MDKIKISIELPKASEVNKNLKELLTQVQNKTKLTLDLDASNFKASVGEVSQMLGKLKTQISSMGSVEELLKSSAISKSTSELERQNVVLREQQKLLEDRVTKTSSTSRINENGEQVLIKDLKTIKDEYGNIIEVVNKYNSKTGEITDTLIKSTNEVEKQRVANEKAIKDRQKLEQDYENWWLKSLKNREVKEQESRDKSLSDYAKAYEKIENVKDSLQQKLNTSLKNQNFTLIDDGVFENIQKRIDSLVTTTPQREIDELKRAISNLSSSDSQIVRLQNAISKYGISIENLTEKYKGIVPEAELDEAISKIENLEDVLKRIQSGETFTNQHISSVLNDASASMTKFGNATKNANTEFVSFGDAFKDIASKVGIFNIVDDAINKMKSGFREGVQAVIEMDTELSNLQKVIDGLSDKQLIQMRDSAVEIGVSLGRSSTEIMASMAEFGKQFKDTDIVKQLSELSVMATNTMENISADQVAKSLTTILSSMELGVDDAKTILDGLNEIQNNFRIDSSDLLEGLAEVGSVAKTSGIELDRLNGYITSIVMTTGGSGSEVGNALQTIFSRIYGVGKKTIEGLGVAVQDMNGEFRSGTEILDDLAKKWKTMSDTQKISSAQSIAGVQRYNQLVALMNNYDTAIQAAETSLDSLDSVQKENATYLNSIEGRMTSLKTATEGFWYNLISSDMIKGSVSTLEALIKGFDGLQKTFGSLGLTVGTLSTAFLTFTNNPMKNFLTNMIKTDGVVKGFTDIFKNLKQEISSTGTTMGVAQKSVTALKSAYEALGVKAMVTQAKVALLQATLSMGVSLLASWAISGIISSFTSVEERIQKTTEASKELSDTLSNFKDNNVNLSRYEEIQKKLQDTKLTQEEINELNDELATVKSSLYTMDDDAKTILDNTNIGYEEQLQLLKQINEQKLKETAMELDKSLGNGFWGQDEEKNAKQAAESLNIQAELYKEAQEKFKNASSDTITLSNGVTLAVKDQDEYLGKLKDSMNDNLLTVQKYNSNVALIEKANINSGRSTVELDGDVKKFTLSLNESTDALEKNTNAKEENANTGSGGETIDTASIAKATEIYNDSKNTVESLKDAIVDLNEEGKVTPELISSLAKLSPDIYSLGAGIYDMATVQEYLNQQIAEQAMIQAEAYDTMIASDTAYYENKIKNNEEFKQAFANSVNDILNIQGESYDVDFSRFTNLNDLKKGILNDFGVTNGNVMNSILDMYAKAYTFDSNNFADLQSMKEGYLNQLLPAIANWIASNISSVCTEMCIGHRFNCR